MSRQEKNIVLAGKHDKPILTDVFYTAQRTELPVIIFCHGYKGFKDWGAWDLVAKTFADAGFFFIKFNFSHNGGTIEKPVDFSDLEAFGNNNYVKELDDVETVLDWVTQSDHAYTSYINSNDITLIGHSRGGGIATIKAAEDTRVKRLITWAGVSDYESRFPVGAALVQWKQDHVLYVENGRTKQQMPHYFQFYTSFMEEKERLTISNAVARIQIPHLIIHGAADLTVDVQEAKNIHHWNPKSQLFVVEGMDHVFGAKHPWEKHILPNDLLTIIEKSVELAIN